MTLEAGRTIAHDRRERKIGAGGMGIVYEAEDTETLHTPRPRGAGKVLRAIVAGVSLLAVVVPARAAGYDDLVALFKEWRRFQAPPLTDGVPDYSAAAMAAQRVALPAMRKRLEAFDPRSWPVEQQVDWQIVRAEMNGLDFDHRVLRPWERNPAFYVTVFPDRSDQPAREGPLAWGGVDLWRYDDPLSAGDAAMVKSGLDRIPPLLQQARTNLTGRARDLWVQGTKAIRQQGRDLEAFEAKVKAATPALLAPIEAARKATDTFAAWLDAQAASRTERSGIGVENYDWYLKNVQLLPYTWDEEVALVQRELGRAHAFLKLEEIRDLGLPELVPVASEAEHDARYTEALRRYMAFLADRRILTLKPYLEPELRGSLGRFDPGPRDFFTEVDYRDPEVLRTHGYHWFDLARMKNEPHPSPIRRGALLYNIFDSRTEGFATGFEEMMLQAGMFDGSPRSRELVYVLLAQRAARAMGDLMMHANRFTLDEAVAYATANTPRGWLRSTLPTVWGEQFLYLQQPAYGTSYVIGKMEVEKLLRDSAARMGTEFSMQRFMDDFNAAGLIPIALIRLQMTGVSPEIAEMLTIDGRSE